MSSSKDANDLKQSQKASCLLYIAAASALMGAIGMGGVLGWTAPAFDWMSKEGSVPRLQSNNTEDKSAKTWIGSSMTLGALVGAVISGPMATYFGRRNALISYGVPFTIGWLLMAFAKSVAVIIAGRVIVGFSSGLYTGTVPTYVVEISIIRIRGLLGAGFQTGVTIGILIVYILGAWIDWPLLAGLSAIPTILMSGLLFFMPETPVWLLAHKRPDEAEAALKSLRGAESDTAQELHQMKEQMRLAEKGESFSLSLYGRRLHFCPMLLALGLMFFQQFSGINAVKFYATDIFKESGSSIEPKYATIIIGAAQVVATVFSSLLVDQLGRRILLSASGFLHATSMAALGLYYYCIGEGAVSYGWMPIVSLVVFIVGYSTGWGPVPWLMIAEITPNLSRSATSAFATAFNWTCAFMVSKFFESLKNALTKHGAFFLFSGIAVFSIIFALAALPETKGKSQAEILEYFGGPKAGEDGEAGGGEPKKNTEVAEAKVKA